MNFVCPYCNKPTTITDPNQFVHWNRIIINESDKGNVGFTIFAITCPNSECNKLFLKVSLTDAVNNQTTSWDWKPKNILQQWQLLPESEAKALPNYIPPAIQQDYYEACRIRDLSPKASATLSRRCLQGMIRDFWKITKGNLKEEIEALQDKVDLDVWGSIDAVRSVGNIGAHMEKDINVIVDVEPKEAQLLIGLIEQLIDEWYIARNNRKKRTEKLKELVNTKNQIEKEENNND